MGMGTLGDVSWLSPVGGWLVVGGFSCASVGWSAKVVPVDPSLVCSVQTKVALHVSPWFLLGYSRRFGGGVGLASSVWLTLICSSALFIGWPQQCPTFGPPRKCCHRKSPIIGIHGPKHFFDLCGIVPLWSFKKGVFDTFHFCKIVPAEDVLARKSHLGVSIFHLFSDSLIFGFWIKRSLKST